MNPSDQSLPLLARELGLHLQLDGVAHEVLDGGAHVLPGSLTSDCAPVPEALACE